MSEDQQEASIQAAERRLETWKEIAEYLRREVRTVQRWEREQGLPVRRHAHQKRSSVYAFSRELDEWRITRSPKLDQPQSRWSRRAVLLTAAASIVLAAILLTGWRAWSRFRASSTFQKTEIRPLIVPGNALAAAISPDDRYLAYSLSGTGGQSAWLRDLASGANTQIGVPAEGGYRDLKFSPDGEFLRFFQAEGLYQTQIRGGPVSKIAQGTPGYLGLSPDGKRLALRRRVDDTTHLLVTNLDGSGERSIAVRKVPGSIQYLSWSPDGKRIAFVAGASAFAGTNATLVVVDV